MEATCNEAKHLGLRKPALLGTRFTMQGGFYTAVFSRAGMELVVPDPSEQSYLHEKYMNELLKGVFLPETHQGLLKLVESLKTREGVDSIILGGTELPLILREPEHAGIPFLDTTQIHVRAAVDEMLR